MLTLEGVSALQRAALVRIGSRASWALAGVVVAAATLLSFWPLTAGETFHDIANRQSTLYPWMGFAPTPRPALHYDQTDSFYPWRVFEQRALLSGELPLWNPFSFSGQPFLANGQNGVLYPPRLVLALLVSPERVYDLLLVSHMVIGGLAMLVLLRSAHLSPSPAVFGAVAWMLNSFMLAWMVTEHYLVVEAWLPFALYLVSRAIHQASWKSSLLNGVVLALMFLGGNLLFVEVALLAWSAYAGFLVLKPVWGTERAQNASDRLINLLRRTAMPAAGLVTMVGLSAFQLFPTLELVRSMQRGLPTYDEILAARLPVSHLLNLAGPFVPLVDVYHSALFVGTGTAVLALIGCTSRFELARYTGWLALVVILFSLGTFVTWLGYTLVPGVGYLKPSSRSLFLFDFALAVLAAGGLDLLVRDAARLSRWTRVAHWWVLAAAVVLAVLDLTNLSKRLDPWPHTLFLANIVLLVLLSLRGLMARGHWRWATPALVGGLIIVLFLQMHAFGDTFIRHQPDDSALLYPDTPLVEAIRNTKESRMLPILPERGVGGTHEGRLFFASTAMVFPLENASGYDSLVPDRISRLWRVVEGVSPQDAVAERRIYAYGPEFFVKTTRFDLLSRLGITHLVAPPYIEEDPEWASRVSAFGLRPRYSGPDGKVYAVAEPLPRTYVVTNCEAVPTALVALQRFTDPSFEARKTVIIESDRLPIDAAQCRGPSALSSMSTGDARIASRTLNTMSIEVQSAADSWLVIGETWDAGWNASVDGIPASVLPADYAFRALRVPAGIHQVSLWYWPMSYAIGSAVSGTALAILTLFAIVNVARRFGNRRHAVTMAK